MKESDHFSNVPLIATKRGGIIENIYRGSVVILDSNKKKIAAIGNADLISVMRSTAKPFQIIPLIEHQDYHILDISQRELAVMIGSHNAEEEHIHVLMNLLRKHNINDKDLSCGVHPPFIFSIAEQVLYTERKRITEIYNNCSGNHISMILLARLMNISADNYFRRDHPVQKRIRDIIARIAGVKTNQLRLAIDGCNIPTYGLSLSSIAYAYARLAKVSNDDEFSYSLNQIRSAMLKYPFYIAGSERLETELIEKKGFLAKIGADGIYCIGVPSQEVGIVIKIESGCFDALECAVAQVLVSLGLVDPVEDQWIEKYRYMRIRTNTGQEVGNYYPIKSNFRLRFSKAKRGQVSS